jgi:hypothetical protein
VYGTGPYHKYEGGIFSEVIVSPDPNYEANITLVVNDDAASAVSGDVRLNVISEGGYYAAITDPETGDQIGARFQSLVFDHRLGKGSVPTRGMASFSLPTTLRARSAKEIVTSS